MVGRASTSRASLVPFPKATAICRRNPAGNSAVDLGVLARELPGAWAAWLTANFRTVSDIQKAFPPVSERTVRDWLAGISAPRAPVILKVCDEYPQALPALLGRVAA